MTKLLKPFIRTSAFIRKEIFEILRQPRLLITLVLGPFLILLVFGIGYVNKARALRTLIVVPKNIPFRQLAEQYAKTLGPQLIYEGVTENEDAALDELRHGQIDLVAVIPANAYETIRESKQVVITLYHREIDPLQVSYVEYFGQVYVDEVNRRVLLAVTEQGQKGASNIDSELKSARSNAAAMRNALKAGDINSARQYQAQLSHNLDAISQAAGISLGVLDIVQQTFGDGVSGDAGKILALLSDVQNNTQSLGNMDQLSGNYSQADGKLSKIEDDLTVLQSQLKQFTSINPDVLIRPFRSQAVDIAPIHPTALDFFAPAVIALLLQHLAVTFGALSIVRERNVGTIELFRVSPLSAGETLFGKYMSYVLFGGLLTLALTLLLVFVLHVPMLGSWLDYALVIAVLLFTSLGIGFLISLVSQTDSQAVQYTMIILLASVFFSGFMMSLDTIRIPVRVLSWSLPTTYGIILLRDIVLRGLHPDTTLLGGLALLGLGLCLVAWQLLRRLVSSH